MNYIASGDVGKSQGISVLENLFESPLGDVDKIVKTEEVFLEKQMHVLANVVHDMGIADCVVNQMNLATDYQKLK